MSSAHPSLMMPNPGQEILVDDIAPPTAPPAPVIPTAACTMLHVPLDALRPSPVNRHTRDDDPKVRELADSLRTLGQLQPIVIRELAGVADCYQILAGERRWRAAKLAGLPTIEAKLLECDDRTALHVTVVENLQRQDLSPLEEARGVRALLDGAWPVEEIAVQLGKSPRWVVSRAAITNLSPKWLDGLAKDTWPWLGVAHLEQVGRLPLETQEALADWADDRGSWPMSAGDLAKEIETNWMHVLSAAPWQMDDAGLLPEAGPCNGCPKRSGCQQLLFADLAKKDRCLDANCWKNKAAAQTLRKAAELRQNEERVVVLSSRDTEAPKGLPKDVPVLAHSYAVRECKKTEPGAVKAIDAASGRQTWIKPADYAPPEVHAACGSTPKRDASGRKTGTASAGDSAAIEAARRVAKRFKHRFAAIEGAADGAKRPADDVLFGLAAILLVSEWVPVTKAATWKAIAALDGAKARGRVWDQVCERLCGSETQVMSTALPEAAAVEAMERLVGLDPKAQLAAAEAAVPEPQPKPSKTGRASKPGSGKVAKPKQAAKAKKGKA
jgi:ParB/RepB/Spo0J family partition protein